MSWRQYLAREIGQRVLSSLAEEAAKTSADADGELEPRHDAAQESKDNRRCDVGLVFALASERHGLEDRLDGVIKITAGGFTLREGGLAGRRIVMIDSGIGRERAARATRALIEGHQPTWLISAGFAGGLDPRLKLNDVVVVEEVSDVGGGRHDIAWPFDREEFAAKDRTHVGRLLTVDQVVRTSEQKRSLGQEFAVLAVDMETAAIAAVCREQNVPLLSVRVISDTVDEELPAEIERLIRKQSIAGQLGVAVAAIYNRPGSLKDMLNLRERSLVASDRMALFLDELIRRLPQCTPRETGP